MVAIVFFTIYDRFVVRPQVEAKALQAQVLEAERQDTIESGTTTTATTPAFQAPASSATASAPAPISAASGKVIATVTTAISRIEIDELGRIRQVSLSGKVFEGENSEAQTLFDPTHTRALEIRFADRTLNDAAFKIAYSASASSINASLSPAPLVLTQQLDGVTVTKSLVFYPDGHYDLTASAQGGGEFYITPGFHPNAASDPMTVQGALTQTATGVIETIADGDAKGGEHFEGAKMVSAFDRYYATLFYNYQTPINVTFLKQGDGDPLAFVRVSSEIKLGGYVGPKYVAVLESIDPQLGGAVEYGFFTFLSKPLFVVLEWIYSLVPNWGFAIVIFTVLVKIVLFPLSHKGMVSMAKLKDLAPKMKELQEKYKDDKQKLQIHMMELYKKHGANPLGGCLPLILQIPIFFAIYRVLLNAIELKGAEWLYIGDLSLRDPFFALPLLMGATMYLQQRITPSNFTDPMQEKLFKWLPVIFTAFFLMFPAGLVLYWLVNNIVSIAQQWFVNRHMEKIKLSHKEENNEKN